MTHHWLQSLGSPKCERKLLLLCSDNYILLWKIQKERFKRAGCVWSLHCHVPEDCNPKHSASFRKFKFVLGWEKNCCLILSNKRCRSTSLQFTYIILNLKFKAFCGMTLHTVVFRGSCYFLFVPWIRRQHVHLKHWYLPWRQYSVTTQIMI